MPTFPTYRGELPACLSPLNPRHYLLLAYWVFFCPIALKCYLYQTDSGLYRAEGWLGIVRSWRVPAYRNLYLMVPGTVLLLLILVGFPIVIIASWIQSVPIVWLQWLRDIVFSMAMGMAMGMVVSMVVSMVASIAFGMAFGVTFGVAFGVVIGLGLEVVPDMAGGMALGIAFALAFAVVVGVAFGVGLGLVFGVAGGVAIGMVYGVVFSVVVLHILPFYPFQLFLAWANQDHRVKHPLEWDDVLVLPLPGSLRVLIHQLEKNERDGLLLAAKVSRNPFQRWVAQRALQLYFHNKVASLDLLYTILTCSSLNEYVFAPLIELQWNGLPSAKSLLAIGE